MNTTTNGHRSQKVLPTVSEHTTPERYAARYIARVISEPTIEPPDANTAGDHLELLQSLYTTHTGYGADAAAKAWRPLKKFHRELDAAIQQPDGQLLHATELRNLPSPEYQLEEYPIYKVGLNVIVGESGSGKSFLALDIAAKTALHEPTIYIVGEGLYGYAARWEVWSAHHNAEKADLWFYPRELDFSSMNELSMFVDLVQRHRPKLIVIDTVARCMGELDENSTRDMGLFIKRTSYLRQQLGCGVLLVHHTGKNGLMRGSSALYGAADGILFVAKTESHMTIFNDRDRGGKNKDAEPWEPMHREFIPRELNGYKSVILQPAEKISYDLSDPDLLTSNQREILQALADHGQCRPTDLEAVTALSRSTVFRNIRKLLKYDYITNQDGIYQITDTGKATLSND
jgi:uncharacterized membrane protein